MAEHRQRLYANPTRANAAAVGGNSGFFPAPGTDYAYGNEPELANRLSRLARALKLHLTGISGHRTPEHSVAVGGFANDPHTRGEASDTPGIEKVSETTLEKYGLTRPFAGARELNHIQLFGGNATSTKGTVTSRPRGRRPDGPADWLKQAGWPSNLIPTMVAIGGAESGWNISAESPKNTDGSTDYGWLQVNSIHGYDPVRLKSDPVYNARAGYAIYKRQGLTAWSVYNNGAYKSFIGKTPEKSPGVTRPGGQSDSAPSNTGTGGGGGSGGGGDPNTELVAFWDHLPDLPNPLQLFKDAGATVNSVGDFLKWIAWIFHPLNILRVVEFISGMQIIIMGFVAVLASWKGASAETVVSLLPQARAAKAVTAGKTAKTATARTARQPAPQPLPVT